MVPMRKHSKPRVYLQTKQTGLFWSRSGEFGALWLKMTREAFFFTCYGVFDVIGWFPCENTRKREFTCKRSKPGCFGAVRVKSVRSEEHTSELQSRQYLVCR